MAHLILIMVALLVVIAAPAQAAPYVNGPVSSLLVDGDTLYVGGTFSAAGAAAGPLSFVDPGDGRVLATQAGFSGRGTPMSLEVRAVLADGAGGWYVGGQFDRVDGWPRGSLVRLRADGSVDPEFHIEVAGTVDALARHGSALWVGGDIQEIGGSSAPYLGAVDAETGARLPVQPPGGWGPVNDLHVSGARLYVGGPRGLISLDASTGARDTWAPEITGEVESLDVRDGVVYVASPATGAVALRESDAGLVVRYGARSASAIEAGDGVVVVRGGGTLAAFEPTTGANRSWFGELPPVADGAIAIAGSSLYAADIAGGFAAFDLRDGSRVPWAPPLLGGRVRTLAGGNGVVAVGGTQAALNGVPRRNLAAFDLRTGAVTSFAPELGSGEAVVRTLHKLGGVLYAGGTLDPAGGHLAAFAAPTGARLPFAEATAPVHAITSSGDTLYVGGVRGRLGAVEHDGLAAVSRATGTALPWAPALGCDVDALAVSGAMLHVGGCFGLRSYRDLVHAPAPAISGRVLALLADGAGGLWAGGAFAGGNIAHFDAGGAPLVDSPVTDGPVHALARQGTTLHIGGRFTRVQDAPRVNVSQVNLIGGAVAGFNPRPSDAVTALAPLGSDGIAFGGGFDSTWEATTGGLATFGLPEPRRKTRPAPWPTRPKPGP